MQIDLNAKTPLADQAYAALRSGILSGSLSAGGKLRIEALQRDYQISSSPLREALNRLVAENLVLADENRGFRAAPISAPDLRDLTDARVVVEPGALEESMRKGSDVWEGAMMAAFHRLKRVEQLVDAGEMERGDEWMSRHKEFHMALVSGCGSERLISSCGKLFDQSERYRRLSASLRGRSRNTAAEHRLIVKTALARDPKAVTYLRQHIEKTAQHVITALSKAAE